MYKKDSTARITSRQSEYKGGSGLQSKNVSDSDLQRKSYSIHGEEVLVGNSYAISLGFISKGNQMQKTMTKSAWQGGQGRPGHMKEKLALKSHLTNTM